MKTVKTLTYLLVQFLHPGPVLILLNYTSPYHPYDNTIFKASKDLPKKTLQPNLKLPRNNQYF